MEIKSNYLVISPLLGEIHWDASPSDTLLSLQLAYIGFLQNNFADLILDLRQGFTSVAIYWKNPQAQSAFQEQFEAITIDPKVLTEKTWQVPVCYEEPFAKDLEQLVHQKNIEVSELIALHSSVIYRIHFFGFLPGFMYLHGLPERLHFPRKAVPDRAVPRGSVAIGGAQTGIYPRESPGGWHIIGQTPILLFDREKNPPVWASPGDRLKFVPITSMEMEELLKNPPLPTCI